MRHSSIEPNNPVLLYWYGGFQLRALNETTTAIDSFRKAKEIEPDVMPISIELSRALTFIQEWDEAASISLPIVKAENIPLRWSRVAADGSVQIFRRKLEYLLDQQRVEDALEWLGYTAKQIELFERKSFDAKVLSQIGRVVSTASLLEGMIFNPEQRDEYQSHIASAAIDLLMKDSSKSTNYAQRRLDKVITSR